MSFKVRISIKICTITPMRIIMFLRRLISLLVMQYRYLPALSLVCVRTVETFKSFKHNVTHNRGSSKRDRPFFFYFLHRVHYCLLRQNIIPNYLGTHGAAVRFVRCSVWTDSVQSTTTTNRNRDDRRPETRGGGTFVSMKGRVGVVSITTPSSLLLYLQSFLNYV